MKEDRLPKRVPESELMAPEEAMTFAKSNDIALRSGKMYSTIAHVFNTCKNFTGRGRMLDLACGSACSSLAAALMFPELQCLAVDADPTMVGFASACVGRMKMRERVQVQKAHIPHDKVEGKFDLVYSRSSLHHFSNPLDFWKTVKDCVKDDGSIFVFDLARPTSLEAAEELVRKGCPDGSEQHWEIYLRSFLAAYRPQEVREQLETVGLTGCRIMGLQPSHMVIFR